MPSPLTQTEESYNEEVPIVLSKKVPTAKGYVFFGWSLDPDAYYKDVEWSYGDPITL
jgi:hypothetical protein